MGLIHPSGPSWAHYSNNITGVLPGAGTPTYGVAVLSGTSSADGSDVTILSALSHDVEYLRLVLAANPTSGVDNNALMDILVDPAGGTSWSVLIPSLAVGGLSTMFTSSQDPRAPCGGYDFPIWIPAGATLGARVRNSGGTAQTINVGVFAQGGNSNPASWWCGQRVSAIGIDAANSRGSSHTAGLSSTYSSWANFGSTLGEACGAVQWAVMGDHSGGAWANRGYQFEFGVGGVRYGGQVDRTTSTFENGFWIPTGPIFHRFPAGTQFQCRGRTAAASGGNVSSVAAYAVH